MATVDYPTTIPGPTQLTSEPKVRARNSGLPGNIGYTAPERDYYGTVSVNFFFNRDQAAIFKAWWDTNQGYWFNAVWPRLSQSLSVYRILGVPTFNHVYDGAYRVSAKVELRGASLAVAVADPCDPHFDKVALQCDFEGGTLNSSAPTVISNANNTLTVLGNPGFGGTVTEDKRFGNRGAKVVGNSSALIFNRPTGWVGRPTYAPRTDDFCLEVWAKFPTGAASGEVFSFSFDSTNVKYAALYFDAGGAFFVTQLVAIGNQPTVASGTGIPINQWFHLAWARSGGVSRIFVDGAVRASWIDTYDYNTSELQVKVPTNSINGNTGVVYYDELRMTVGNGRYSGPFTPRDEPFLTVGCALPADDPHWSEVALLMEFEGGNARDLGPSNRIVQSIRAAPTFSTSIAKVGTTSMFGGGHPVGLITNLGTRASTLSWCLEFWYFRTEDGNDIAFGGDDVGNRKIGLRTPNNSGAYQFGLLGLNLLEPTSVFTTETIPLNTWVHLCASVEKTDNTGNGTLRLFIDGQKKREVTGVGMAPSGNWDIGRSDNAGFSGYRGHIDSYRLTVGHHRYSTNFTPNTEPHPRS